MCLRIKTDFPKGSHDRGLEILHLFKKIKIIKLKIHNCFLCFILRILNLKIIG